MIRLSPRGAIRLASLLCLMAPLSASAASSAPPEWVAFPLSPEQESADRERLDAALGALLRERPGTVDAYVVVAALDADPVFGREAREAGRVLARRFDAAGRTIVLAGDEGQSRADAPASPDNLARALNRAGELMDPREDVLVLYTTSHGAPRAGLVWKDALRGGGIISPARLSLMLQAMGAKNRLIILQACYSGQFVRPLKGPRTVVATAAADDRTSFGCEAGNDWTYFGDALVNHAFRQPLPLDIQFRRASALIAAAENRDGLTPSNPQFNIGSDAAKWLGALDEREPAEELAPVGQTVLGLGR